MTPEVLYEHQSKLETRLAETRQRIESLKGRLANESYVAQAPPRVVEETRTQLTEQETLAERLRRELDVI